MAKNATNPVEETPVEKKAKSVKKAKPVKKEKPTKADGTVPKIVLTNEDGKPVAEMPLPTAEETREVVNVDPGTGKPLPKWTTVISKKGESAKPVEVKTATPDGVLKTLAASIEKEKAANGVKKPEDVSGAHTSTGAGKMTTKKYVESTVRPAFEALVLGVKQNLIAEGKIDAEDNTFDYEVWVYKDYDRKQQCVEIHMTGEDAIHYLYDDKATVNALKASVKLNMEGVIGKVPEPITLIDEGEKYFILY